jgi:putative hydrolase of the HAD superfamily
MAPRAVVLDIGGVLEVTPQTGWQRRWEARLGLADERIDARLHDVYRAGSIGAMSVADVERAIGAALGLGAPEVAELLEDLWAEYLGTLDAPLARWFGALRPRYATGILSNSWVGAREREHARYGFGDLCDTIVYSHEEGLEKPDPRAYLRVCARLGVRLDQAAFLDDVRANVDAARALGMAAVLHRGDAAESIAAMEALLAGG